MTADGVPREAMVLAMFEFRSGSEARTVIVACPASAPPEPQTEPEARP
jgi:hypothetical protein